MPFKLIMQCQGLFGHCEVGWVVRMMWMLYTAQFVQFINCAVH